MSFWSQKKILQKIHFWFFVLFPFILAITSADPVLWNIKLMLPWITNCSLQEVDVTLLHRWRKCTQNKSQETRVCVSKIHAHIFNCKRTWRIHQAKTNVTSGLLQEEHWTLPPLVHDQNNTGGIKREELSHAESSLYGKALSGFSCTEQKLSVKSPKPTQRRKWRIQLRGRSKHPFFTKTKYKLYFSSHYPLPAVLLLSLGPTVSLLWTITNAFLKT